MKLKEKKYAIRLRREGKTMNEIATRVGVAKSSVSLWVRNLPLSSKARARIASLQTAGQQASQKALFARTRKRLLLAKENAEKVVRGISLTPDLSLLLCALLYWCEGAKDKNDTTFTFSNSDSQLVRGFMKLMRAALVLEERKFRVRMHLHEYHNEIAQRKFWSEVTDISEELFAKTYWKPHTAKTIKEGYPGCVHIEYYDVVVARKIYATARAFIESVVK
jgi:transposase-like protein